MKKTALTCAFLSALLPAIIQNANATDTPLDISGNIDVLFGYQKDDNHAFGIPVGGQLGWFRGPTAASRDTLNFYLDQAEIDFNRELGEHVRIRLDVDLGRTLSGSARNTDSGGSGSNIEVEQAYLTFGIGDAEILMGRFNVPIGYYLVDRADNPTISFSNIFNYLTPTNATGLKLFYAFGEHVDLNVYLVNNLADSIAFGFEIPGGTTPNPGGLDSYSNIPSYGTRIGFNWGDEDTKSTIGISYAGGPERFGCEGGNKACNGDLTHILDLDFAIKLNAKFLVAGEAIYRQDSSNIDGVPDDKVWGAFLLANYDINENWRIFGRYGFLQDRTGYYTSLNQNIHDIAVGFGYEITEGAKIKIEYSPTLFDPRIPETSSSWSHGFAVEMAYNF